MGKWEKYQCVMWKRTIDETSRIYGGIVNMIIAQTISIPLAVLVGRLLGESGKWYPYIVAAAIALLPIIGMILLQRAIAPIMIFNEQSKRLELKEYEDIDIEKFESPETIDEKRGRLFQNSRDRKLEFLVWNRGSVGLQSANIKMISIKSHNPKYTNRPEGIETKPFRWADYPSVDGKVNIAPNSREKLIVAIYSNQPYGAFSFAFYDGDSKVLRTLPGKYTVKIQLEGQAKKGNVIEDLSPIPFILSFDFDNLSLRNSKIIKLPRKQNSLITRIRTTDASNRLPASRKKADGKKSTRRAKTSL